MRFKVSGKKKKECSKGREVTQSCPTLSDPMDCSPPGSSVHGIFQAKAGKGLRISLCSVLHGPQLESGFQGLMPHMFFWRRQWHPTPILLPGKFHGWRSLEGCSRWGHLGSDTTERLHFHALEKEMATHSSVLAWRTPGTGKPGRLPSLGSHRVGHDK